jgi:allantoinase
MTEPKLGMDHALYPFSPITARPPLTWPGDAPLAVSVFLYLEHWDLLPGPDAMRDPRFRDQHGDFQPDYRTYTLREYGNRAGIFRLLEAFERLNIPVTVAANVTALNRYPYLVEQLLRNGYEFAAHGHDATRMVTSRMTAEEERSFIQTSVEAVTRATGTMPRGWIGQDYSESVRTPGLLAELGLSYVVDWPNDDQPYLMNAQSDSGPIVSIPNQSEWDDIQLMWHRRVLATRFPGIVRDAIGTLSRDAKASNSGRFFGLHLHPWLSGMPHRAAYAVEALETLAAAPEAWLAYAGDVAERTMHQLRSSGIADTERLQPASLGTNPGAVKD